MCACFRAEVGYILHVFAPWCQKLNAFYMFLHHGAKKCILHVFTPWCENLPQVFAHVYMFPRHGAKTCICLHVLAPWRENMHMSPCFRAMVRKHVFVYMFSRHVRKHAHVCMFLHHGAKNMHMFACIRVTVREIVTSECKLYSWSVSWGIRIVKGVFFLIKINYLKNVILALKKCSYRFSGFCAKICTKTKKIHVFALLRENMCFILKKKN